MTPAMNALREATLKARSRLADKRIGTCVEQGRFRVVRVTLQNRKAAQVEPLSDWGTVDETVRFLDSL